MAKGWDGVMRGSGSSSNVDKKTLTYQKKNCLVKNGMSNR